MAYAFLVVASAFTALFLILILLLNQALKDMAVWLDLFYGLEANRKPIKVDVVLKDKDTPSPDSYEPLVSPGVFNPEEEDMVSWLQQYGEFHPIATSNPYRGWKVFDTDGD